MAVVGLNKASVSSIRRQIERMQTESDNAEKKIRSALTGLDFEVAAKQNIRNCLNSLITSANRQGGLSAQYKSAFLNVTGSLTESDAKFGNRSQSILDRIGKYTYTGIRGIGSLFTRNKLAKYAVVAGLFLGNPVVTVAGVLSSDKARSACVKAGKKCVSAVRKEFLNEDGSFDYEKLKQYGKAAVKVAAGAVKVVGAVGAMLFTSGTSIPLSVMTVITGVNDIASGFADMSYVHKEQYDMVGKSNVLKNYLVESTGEIGGYFGNSAAGEYVGNLIYTGVEVVTFLDGADKMLTAMGKANTILTGQYGSSSGFFWDMEKVSFEAIDNSKIKFALEPDYFIRKILKIDPASDANIFYEAAKSVRKMFGKASELGKQIGSLT